MTRDKLLTIRIEEDKREAFNNWCESREYNYSRFLYEVIEACLDGRIDKSILNSQSIDTNLANRLDKRIDKLERQIDSRSIDIKIDKNLVSTEDLNKAISEALPSMIASQISDEKFIETIAMRVHNLVTGSPKIEGAECSTDDPPPTSVPKGTREKSASPAPHSALKLETALPNVDREQDSSKLTDGELSKLINADRAMLYRWRTGDKPKRPSKRYKEVMKDWEVRGDRWYRK